MDGFFVVWKDFEANGMVVFGSSYDIDDRTILRAVEDLLYRKYCMAYCLGENVCVNWTVGRMPTTAALSVLEFRIDVIQAENVRIACLKRRSDKSPLQTLDKPLTNTRSTCRCDNEAQICVKKKFRVLRAQTQLREIEIFYCSEQQNRCLRLLHLLRLVTCPWIRTYFPTWHKDPLFILFSLKFKIINVATVTQ